MVEKHSKSLDFKFEDTALVDIPKIKEILNTLEPEIEVLNHAINQAYKTNYAPINLPTDQDLIVKVKKIAQKLKKVNPTAIFIIGIGGSNLGTLALFQALKGYFYNNLNPEVALYCADTIDNDYLLQLLSIAQNELKKNNNIIINIVSKSASTTETIVNGLLFLDLLKKYKDNYSDYVVITTDKDSQLWQIAKEQDFALLEIPKLVGGRFSVLSAVGLFPLEMITVDIEKLQAGALTIRALCLKKGMENIAAISAAIIFYHYKNCKNINDLFLFSPDLNNLGAWYRQLVGETLGKKESKTGQIINTGITPTVSIGTTDLHSVAQLYLGGPLDKITTFVSFEHEKSDVFVPDKILQKERAPHFALNLRNKSVTFIKKSILCGVKIAYKKEKRPFISIILQKKDEYNLGQFIMFKIFEIIYLAKLLNVNPFDQPAVELYKEETRRLLAK